MKRNRIALRIATKYLEDISDMLDPSESLKTESSLKPDDVIMQKDKVIHNHFEREGEPEDFERVPEYDEINYLVRYLVNEQGKKRKKDSF